LYIRVGVNTLGVRTATGDYKYKPSVVKHNSIIDFITVYLLHCFVQRRVSALVMSLLQVDYSS